MGFCPLSVAMETRVMSVTIYDFIARSCRWKEHRLKQIFSLWEDKGLQVRTRGIGGAVWGAELQDYIAGATGWC